MKKLIAIALLYFTHLICYSQSPIQVTVTGQCSPVTGTYIYTGLVNGKNNYAQTFLIEGINATIAVGFDGVKWVLYGNNDLTDPGFINLAINGLLPPLTGWSTVLPNGCPNGTMTINATLSLSDNFEKSSDFVISPNPSNKNIIVSNSKDFDYLFEYKIFDTAGRSVGFGQSNFETEIMIDSLQNGTYFIQIIDQNDTKTVKKFVKN